MMPQTPQTRAPLSHQIAEQLRARIASGQLMPGDKLNEREIMAELDVTRTPLREALLTLMGEKLIEMSPSRGVVVTALTDDQIAELITVRAALERQAGALAAERRSDSDIAQLSEMCAMMDAARERGAAEEWWRLNRLFHRQLLILSGNMALVGYCDNLSLRLTVYDHFNRLGVTQSERWAESSREHEEILDLLRAGNAEGLGKHLHQHLTASWMLARRVVLSRSTGTHLFVSHFQSLMIRADN